MRLLPKTIIAAEGGHCCSEVRTSLGWTTKTAIFRAIFSAEFAKTIASKENNPTPFKPTPQVGSAQPPQVAGPKGIFAAMRETA